MPVVTLLPSLATKFESVPIDRSPDALPRRYAETGITVLSQVPAVSRKAGIDERFTPVSRCALSPMSALGQKFALPHRNIGSRFTPISRHTTTLLGAGDARANRESR